MEILACVWSLVYFNYLGLIKKDMKKIFIVWILLTPSVIFAQEVGIKAGLQIMMPSAVGAKQLGISTDSYFSPAPYLYVKHMLNNDIGLGLMGEAGFSARRFNNSDYIAPQINMLLTETVGKAMFIGGIGYTHNTFPEAYKNIFKSNEITATLGGSIQTGRVGIEARYQLPIVTTVSKTTLTDLNANVVDRVKHKQQGIQILVSYSLNQSGKKSK